MQILITGGLGFIGRALTRKLLENSDHEIVIVDNLLEQVHGKTFDYSAITQNPRVRFIEADICHPGVLDEALKGIDVVYHLAAETGTGQSMYLIEQYYKTNVMGTAMLMEAIVQNPESRPSRVVLSSSRSVYGEGAYVSASDATNSDAVRHYPLARSDDEMKQGKFDFTKDGKELVAVATRETDPTSPRSLYAASKLAQEHICQIACDTIDLQYTALRLQNVYGPGQSLRNPYTGIVSIFTNILRQDGKINVFEDGRESRDFVFVDDVASSFYAVMGLPKGSETVFNIGSGVGVSVQEIVDMLEEKLGKAPSSFVSGEFRPGDIRHNFADTYLMREVLKVLPEVDIKEGLSRTVDWALTQPIEEDRSGQATAELNSLKET